MTDEVSVSQEVADALAEGRAVVALESTLLAQGLAAPENHSVAVAPERLVRKAGAVPATALLPHFHQATEGAAWPADIELVKCNATLAALVAVELSGRPASR